jgi:hypothetical protein
MSHSILNNVRTELRLLCSFHHSIGLWIGMAEIDHSLPRKSVDITHQANLLISLLNQGLIDTYSIHP